LSEKINDFIIFPQCESQFANAVL